MGDALRREYYLAPRLTGRLQLRPALGRVLTREFEELVDLDVPRFAAHPRSRSLWRSDGREVRRFFRNSSWTLCRRRIRALGAAHDRWQQEIARLSVLTVGVGLVSTEATARSADGGAVACSPERLIELAREIGRWCCDRAVVEGGAAEWFGLVQNQHL
jgi:hypothetical protein